LDNLANQRKLNEDLAAELDKLNSGEKIDAKTAKAIDAIDFDAIDPELYEEEFGEEIGALARLVKQLGVQNSGLVDELNNVKSTSNSLVNRHVGNIQTQVQDIIDSIPELSEWQVKDPDKFTKAQEFDNILEADSKFASMPLEERFKKAVSMVNSLYGLESRSKTSKKDVDKAVEDAKANASQKNITSLSHIDATVEDKQGIEKVEDMSSDQLDRMFNRMTPQEMDRWTRDNLGG